MGFESCFWLIDSRSLVCHYKWYLIWKPWDVATSCSQMQPDGSWFVSTRYFFFSKYHLFLEGSVGTANIHYPAAMRSITLPCTVEILLQKPGIYNPFYFLLFQTEDQADWNRVIWGPPVTIERWNHLKEGLIWGNMSKYDERWWHVM